MGLVYGMEEFVMKFLVLPTDLALSYNCSDFECMDFYCPTDWCIPYCGDYDPCPGHLCGGYCTMPEKPDK